MTVNAVGAIANLPEISPRAAEEASGSSLDGLDSNAFLQLLVAQLQHQDPTEPMDSTEYLSQLATYANVEQNTKTNSKLDEVLTAVTVSQASGMIGRTVTSRDGTVSGRVTGYEIYGNGVTLVLEDGSRVVLEPGVKVSEG